MPGEKVGRRARFRAGFSQRIAQRAPVTRQGRSAGSRFRISPKNRVRRARVISDIIFGLEAIRAAAVLADVRLISHLPILNAVSPALIAVFDQLKDQFLPLLVTGRMHDVLFDLRKEHARLETQTQERPRARGQDRFDAPVQRVPMVTSGLWVKIEVFLDEKTDRSGLKPGKLVNVRIDHWLL